MTNRTMGGEPEVFIGIVVKGPDISFCQDGADFVLISRAMHIRLKPVSTQATAEIKKVVGKRIRVLVAGTMVGGVEGHECDHLDAFFIGDPNAALTTMGAGGLADGRAAIDGAGGLADGRAAVDGAGGLADGVTRGS